MLEMLACQYYEWLPFYEHSNNGFHFLVMQVGIFGDLKSPSIVIFKSHKLCIHHVVMYTVYSAHVA